MTPTWRDWLSLAILLPLLFGYFWIMSVIDRVRLRLWPRVHTPAEDSRRRQTLDTIAHFPERR
jgi:hypothetical protein